MYFLVYHVYTHKAHLVKLTKGQRRGAVAKTLRFQMPVIRENVDFAFLKILFGKLQFFPAFSSVLLFRTQQRLLRVGWNDKNHPPVHHQKAFKWLDVFYWIKETAKISSFPSGLTVDLSDLLSTENSNLLHLCCLPIKDGPRWPLEGCRALDSTPLGWRQQPN